ncbi:unnamed protein product [Owenia fusiformis]|uniref:Cyclic nucleotide-binding domain-containing protein n=1 Tax=Owenia fusiformis TaxID=6347 RepID=A0A8S4Q8A3_OWEFU|nr:unnamed protein product [Owenia fusiformis]
MHNLSHSESAKGGASGGVTTPGGTTDGSHGGDRSSAKSSMESSHSEDCSVKLILSPPGSPSKWSRLRHTIKTVNTIQTVNQPVQRKKRKSSGLQRQDSFLKKFSTRQSVAQEAPNSDDDEVVAKQKKDRINQNKAGRFVINPDENVMFCWLAVVTLAVLYNLWSCIAREAFKQLEEGYTAVWVSFDILFDIVYLADIAVQLRTGYLEKGLIVYNSKKLAFHYMKSKFFIWDLVTLAPLDFIQIHESFGIHPIIRFPRFLKVYRLHRFIYMVESRTVYPNVWRVANLTHILFLGSHWFAAFYYMISEAEGYRGGWSYPRPHGEFATVTRKYLKSLYWSMLTLTTIGDLPPPETNWEYVFTIVSYLIGVFVFATIVGQVGNVITNRNASRLEFERLLDGAKVYMRTHNVPPDMQRRVQRWYDYAWSRGRMNGGGDINSLGLLPDKLKTELALHVNLETLKKVTIFQECEPEFLHDLVLKMKAFIFTPGDLICRKGEVAREMFIIADGLLEVISDSGEVLTQMSAGDFLGEIGILNLDGGVNRRTADVRSVGYSELFTLSREDVLDALRDHPQAETLIKEYGNRRLREMESRKKKQSHDPLPTVPEDVLAAIGEGIGGEAKCNSPPSSPLPEYRRRNMRKSSSTELIRTVLAEAKQARLARQLSADGSANKAHSFGDLREKFSRLSRRLSTRRGGSRSSTRIPRKTRQYGGREYLSVGSDEEDQHNQNADNTSQNNDQITIKIENSLSDSERDYEILPSISASLTHSKSCEYLGVWPDNTGQFTLATVDETESVNSLLSISENQSSGSAVNTISTLIVPNEYVFKSKTSDNTNNLSPSNVSHPNSNEVRIEMNAMNNSGSGIGVIRQDSGVQTEYSDKNSNSSSMLLLTSRTNSLDSDPPGDEPICDIMAGMKQLLHGKLEAYQRLFEQKVRHLEEDNLRKNEKIKFLESRVQSLQRALVWKGGVSPSSAPDNPQPGNN